MKICIIDLRNNLQAESSGWLLKSALAGAGAYCGGSTAGRTDCYIYIVYNRTQKTNARLWKTLCF